LVRELTQRGIVAQISGTKLWRWLDQDAIHLGHHQNWIAPRDPQFKRKTDCVLGLYHGLWQDQSLRPDESVIWADEKPGIQPRARLHPNQAAEPHQSMQVDFEYERGGTLVYLAAWDLRRAKIQFRRCDTTTGIVPFDALVEQVMSQAP
jgi:hypothetical protein